MIFGNVITKVLIQYPFEGFKEIVPYVTILKTTPSCPFGW
jgi:hypothetical protein